MRNKNVISVNVPTEEVIINHNEAAMRLKVSRDFENEIIDQCYKELKRIITYNYAYVKVPVKIVNESICDIGFGNVDSFDLCNALKDCSKAYVVGVTTGIGVDRLLTKLSLTSQAKNFITDALASAAVESLCEYVDVKLRGNRKKPMRYSPGYGDMSLKYQPKVLETVDAINTLGITLNSSLLMTPVKSITAIMGVYDV